MPTLYLPIQWPQKLQYFLQTQLLCLVIAGAQHVFKPDMGWEIPLVYSLCIGTLSWALIDFGRHAFASSAAMGWPRGWAGFALPMGGMAVAYVLGTLVADQWFGWASFAFQGRLALPTSILITVLSGTAINFYFYAQSNAQNLQRGVDEARQQATEARLKLLESQLEPHMLFNTLANLRVLIGTDPARAQTMLDHLNGYLRATLSASRTDSRRHTLEQEFERLRDYLELMAVRMGSRLQFTLDLPDALRGLGLPPLLLQPLVENSIRHGLEPKVEGGSLCVSASRSGGQITLEVCDSGLGFTDKRTDTDGFGIASVRERLASAYPGAGRLQFLPRPAGGTRALVTLPA